MSNQIRSAPARRPVVVSVVAALGLVSGVVDGLGGVVFIDLSDATSDSPRSGLMVGLGLGLLVTAVAKVIASICLRRRRAWARPILTAAAIASVVLLVLSLGGSGIVEWVLAELIAGALVVVPAWTGPASRWLRSPG